MPSHGRPRSACDAVRFSGISARMCDFSLAIETGVPEAIQYSQSGHGLPGLALPARAYMHLQTPLALGDLCSFRSLSGLSSDTLTLRWLRVRSHLLAGTARSPL